MPAVNDQAPSPVRMLVSSILTSTLPSVLATVGVRSANPARNLLTTAYGRSHTLPVAACRSNAISSRLSAPVTIPATRDDTFSPAFAP